MTFEFQGEQFKITFSYSRPLGEHIGWLVPVGTICRILHKDGTDWHEVCVGSAVCRDGDNFSYKVGRERALRRSTGAGGWLYLRDLQWVSAFPRDWNRKEWNAAVWKCYLNRKAAKTNAN